MEKPKCRGCGRTLEGKPYWAGGPAYIPGTRERAKANHYGGWVCSKVCDERACLSMESSFPGVGKAKSLSQFAKRSIQSNWG